ncbi:ABC transporter permease [Oryzicola mucosus]|uniref:ABC transporter permease n=1 Tax=Oryzicola mucosus TaxID=2767425 RepID=A0A8J6PRH5_9HYPH|nr:ABC transporter permease [Oryzicola mucosus]MBD0416895.1 ABC transporter permease [Oryzicola mucosus]
MVSYLLRRLPQAALTMLVMSVVVFVGVFAIGNPVDILISPQATATERDNAIRALGLDLPIWQQYWSFLVNLFQGDVGRSFVFNVSALHLIMERLPATLELALASTLLGLVIGMPFGLYAGLAPNSRVSTSIMAGSILGFSLPSFWVGIVMIMLFSVHLGWLPSGGRGDTVYWLGARWSFLTTDGLAHMAMPVLNLALFQISMVIRLTRAGVREVILSDYVKFARAKGLTETRIILVHVLKNILIPVITVVGLNLGTVIAFAVVTETIFSWPGMGKLIIDSINVLDRPVIVAYLMLMVLMFVVINLLVDLAYMVLDPRVRLESR